jgi:hypothetical protein
MMRGLRSGLWFEDIVMFALLRRIGHTARYELPPRPAALCQPCDLDAAALQWRRAAAWRHVPGFGTLLKSVRFSIHTAVCGAVLLLNQLAQDAMSALGEAPGLATVLLIVAAMVRSAAAG